jgi:hypothetical protein
MKIAVKPDQNLPIGPLGPAAFTIPEVLGISPKILQKTDWQKHLGLEASKL